MAFCCTLCNRTWPDDYLPDADSVWSGFEVCEECREVKDGPPKNGLVDND